MTSLVISPPQLRRLLQTDSASELFHIQVCSQAPPPSTPHPTILTIIDQFSALFQPPTTLPPSRTTNHSIHLLPNTVPVNIRLYRYPHFQKQQIKSQVFVMLQNGIIHPSTSPFSFSVLSRRGMAHSASAWIIACSMRSPLRTDFQFPPLMNCWMNWVVDRGRTRIK